jgi:hypothetical protein
VRLGFDTVLFLRFTILKQRLLALRPLQCERYSSQSTISMGTAHLPTNYAILLLETSEMNPAVTARRDQI